MNAGDDRTCLILFAKEPEQGNVKTRLSGYLGRADTTRLYKAFLKDIVRSLRSVRTDEKIMAYEAISGAPSFVRRVAGDFTLYKQRGSDLGGRMHNALTYARSRGASRVVIIGSDAPTLPPAVINDAFRKLKNNDIVIGPSDDGGYYLIGAKKSCRDIFQGIQWSTDGVLAATLKKLRTLKKKFALLKQWYDVDDVSALRLLVLDMLRRRNTDHTPWTKRALTAIAYKKCA